MDKFANILQSYENSAEKRIQSVFQILKEKPPNAVEILIQSLLNDPNPIVRHECAYCLGGLNSEKAAEALIKSIKSDDNKFVIHEASLAVSNLGYNQSKIIPEGLLDHIDEDIIDTAQISLQRLELKGKELEISDPSKTILDLNSKKELRIQAAFMLLEDNSLDAVNILITALRQETSPIVKHEIVFARGETASFDAVNSLTDVLDEETNAFVVHESLLSLATIGDTGVKPLIEKFINHNDKNIADSAEIALERLSNDR